MKIKLIFHEFHSRHKREPYVLPRNRLMRQNAFHGGIRCCVADNREPFREDFQVLESKAETVESHFETEK